MKFLLTILITFVLVPPLSASAGERPNVILMLADDLGSGDLGCFGGPVKTPNLDQLASRGVKLTDFHSGAAVCSPSRATLMTGRQHLRTGIYTVLQDQMHKGHLLTREVTIAEVLKQAGYQTGHFGKWHMGMSSRNHTKPSPAEHGFDYWFGLPNGPDPSHKDPVNFLRNGKPVGPLKGYSCQILIDDAIRWIEEQPGGRRPFFLNIWFNEPHSVIAAPDDIVSQYGDLKDQAAIYSGTIDNADRAIGRLMKKLEGIGQLDNTIIIFSSDHGSYRQDRNLGLRGDKGSLFEGGLRSPGIFFWPKGFVGGRNEAEPCGAVDLLPTICGLVEIDKPKGVQLDGADLTPVLKQSGELKRKQPLFWHLPTSWPAAMVREGRYTLMGYSDYEFPQDHSTMNAILKRIGELVSIDEKDGAGNLRNRAFNGTFVNAEANQLRNLYVQLNTFQESSIPLIKAGGFQKFELYDLTADPQQKRNIAAEQPEVTARLKQQLLTINQSVMADAPEWLTDEEVEVENKSRLELAKSFARSAEKHSDSAKQYPESFWQKIEATALPKGYQGAAHQEFVDAQMEKMEGPRRARVGQLWKEREKSGPQMTNRGASFVKIMMFVAEGEKLDGKPAAQEKPENPKPDKAWFRQGATEKQPIVKAIDAAKNLREAGHPTLLSPHADALALHDGRLFVVNTPAATLDVIDTHTKRIVARVPVGVDPVCVTVRPDGREVWVSNHISDTVSVIDNDPRSPTYLLVVATIQDIDLRKKSTRFDEPSGIAFGDNTKAYVALSSTNRIAVIDVNSRQIVKHIPIPSQEPRSLRVRNGRLYVVPFESNNQTQLSGGKPEEIDGHQVTFDAQKLAASFDSAGFTVDIIKHPETPDRDLYVIDTKTDELIKTVSSLGTLQYGFDVDDNGTVLIAHTEARNHINGRAGTQKHSLKELENRPYLNRVAKVPSSGEAEFFELNPPLPDQPDRETAIATPSAIHIEDGIAYLTAAGSDHLVTLNADTGEILARVRVGAVPRGVVVQSRPQAKQGDRRTAWVFNAVDNSVTEVDVTSPKTLAIRATVLLDDPTPARDKAGHAAFHTARASSSGTFSCASCHPDGHTDQLLWVLDTPHIVGADQIEPRLSQQLRGLRGTAPYHWDGIPGDPYGGPNASTREQLPPNSDINRPESAVRHVIDGGMASTMLQHGSDAVNDEGKKGYLTAAERDAMAEFLLNLNHKPPRARAYSDELSDDALTGIERFHITGNREKQNANTMVCGSCHTMPYLTTDQDSMNVPSFRGALDRFIMQAQGRQNIISLPSYKEVAEKGWPAEESWQRMLHGGEPGRLMPVIDMFKEASTGFSGAFGRQVTVNRQTTQDPVTLDLLAALEKAAMQGTIVLQVTGKFLKPGMNGELLSLTFDSRTDRFVTRPPDNARYSRSELMTMAERGEFVGTFTGHHPGNVVSVPPAIWTAGSLHKQRGTQLFPRVNEDRAPMTISGRHIRDGASLFVNGRRVNGSIQSVGPDLVTVTFDTLPNRGMNMLQVQNPDSYLSNDFIFFVETEDEAVARYAREPAFLLKAILNSAIVNNNPEEARIALQAGAEVDGPHKHFELERPPLILAALYDRESLVDELLRRGASPNIQDRDGTTALHEAARLARLNICRKLLAAGAKPDIANKWKERPADLTDRFVTKGHFEKHFLPWNVNLTLDHERYLRDRPQIQKLLAQAVASGEVARSADLWTGWLGPNRNGWVADVEPPAAWPQSLSKAWSVEVGTGYGSPLVVEDRIYQHARQGDEEVVWCLERATGKLRWQKSFPVPFKSAAGGEYHGNGPKACPVYAAGRLFVMSLNGTLTAWDASSGDKLWQRNYDAEFGKSHPNWGASTSPIVDGEHVIVHFGTDEVGALVALKVATGEEVWRHGKDGPSYSSPLVAEFDRVRQVVEWNHRALVGVDRRTGEFLWEFPLPHVGGDQNMPTPAIHNGRVLLGGENRGIFSLRPERKDGKWSVTEEWHQKKVALDMSSAVINGDFLYGFSHYDSGRLFCLDPKTGDVLWSGPPRTGKNVMFLSLPGHIAALIDNGELRILSATPKEYRQLASYRVADDRTWAPPVLLKDGLLIKDHQYLTKWSLKP